MRRNVLFAAAPACMLLALSPMAAQAALAPPGDATATALKVGELVDVSATGAHAAPDATAADASVLQIGGETVLGLGGTQSTDGSSAGALLDTGSTLPASVQVAPWDASVSGTGTGTRSASSSAAAARADVPGVAELDVLESESEATHQANRSTGAGSSNGVDLGLLDTLRIVLLHSEVSSEGGGSSYLAGINDVTIGTGEELAALCALDAGPLLALSCLTASGGLGGDGLLTGAADVATATSDTLSPISPVSAFAVRASSGTGDETALPAPVAAAPDTAGAADTARALPAADPVVAGASETAGGLSLPRTGAAVSALALLALAAVATGSVLRLAGRRRVLA